MAENELVIGTIVGWCFIAFMFISKRRFNTNRAKELEIKLKELKKTRPDPMDFFYDLFTGAIALVMIFEKPRVLASSILATIVLIICLISLINHIRRLSKREAE